MKVPVKVIAADVKLMSIQEILPTKEDFLYWTFFAMNKHIVPLLSGDKEIIIKLYDNEKEEGKPTIVHTGLQWKTFNFDDNILIMTKHRFNECFLLVTKQYNKEAKQLWIDP
jgi:hypothetical protein